MGYRQGVFTPLGIMTDKEARDHLREVVKVTSVCVRLMEEYTKHCRSDCALNIMNISKMEKAIKDAKYVVESNITYEALGEV